MPAPRDSPAPPKGLSSNCAQQSAAYQSPSYWLPSFLSSLLHSSDESPRPPSKLFPLKSLSWDLLLGRHAANSCVSELACLLAAMENEHEGARMRAPLSFMPVRMLLRAGVHAQVQPPCIMMG